MGATTHRRYTLASRNSSVFEWAMVIFMPRNYTFLRRLPRTFRVTFRPNRRPEFFAADPLPRSTNEGPRTRTPFAPRQRSIVHLDKVLLPSPSATTFNFLRNYYAVTMPEERGVWMIARGKRLMIVSSNLTFGRGFLGGWCSILDVCLLIVQFILQFIRGKVYKLITVSRNFKFGKMDLSSDDNLEFNTYSLR